ncbi:bacterial proteasome activator family protein [uncultured Cellulomonas sp.]|uniref:bacterial proteasome activator family protein n=1 Tax=uncultured Cellulomonas sp. TaxID=189682 RepID=UPI002629B23B|nr:bacterial proteasome activator family protein [uncultured Cellulomonas sp.]
MTTPAAPGPAPSGSPVPAHDAATGDPAQPRIVVVGPDGRPAAGAPEGDAEPHTGSDGGPDGGSDGGADGDPEDPRALVDQPTKVMRIGTMVKQLLEEVRSAPLDEAARSRLAAIHARSVRELEDGLSPELVAELRRITLPLGEGTAPSDAELRVAHAQLVGWLEGLFHGIQTAMVAQRMATQAQAQLAQMRHALPPGADAGQPGLRPMPPAGAADDVRPTPGQYL